MVRQNALKIRSWADVFWVGTSEVTTEGWTSLFFCYDHIYSIIRNMQLLDMLHCSYWLPNSGIPEIVHNMTTTAFHLNYTKIL